MTGILTNVSGSLTKKNLTNFSGRDDICLLLIFSFLAEGVLRFQNMPKFKLSKIVLWGNLLDKVGLFPSLACSGLSSIYCESFTQTGL